MASAPIAQRFRAVYGREPGLVASAPGRVNLVGEHTDYNEGFALPMAIDRRVHVACAQRDDEMIVVHSDRFRERMEIGPSPRDVMTFRSASGSASESTHWHRYVIAVERALRDSGIAVPGCDLLIDAGVPVGAGLSSSAALEIALSRAFCEMARVDWSAPRAARLAQRAENEFVGVRSGIMDQLASACARAGHAMLVDFRSLDIEHVPLPTAVAVVVMDTGIRRSLTNSDYNERRAACERAVAGLQQTGAEVRSLRDATNEMLDAAAARLDDVALDCARHVVAENTRPARLRDALLTGDCAAAGAVMDESHRSLRNLFRVSSSHLDVACEIARAQAACYGARMTGAGFGGCAIALVRADAVADFIARALPAYEARTYKRGEFYVVSADVGARLDLARFQ